MKDIIVELTEEDIVCYHYNNENRMKYDDFGSIKENSTGIEIYGKGIWPHIRKHTTKNNYNNIKGLMFIPICIENFDDVKEFLYSKL